MLYLAYIVFGLLIGILVASIFNYFYNRNRWVATQEQVESFADRMKKVGIMQAHIERVDQITDSQNSIISMLEGPSRGTSHSHTKNKLVSQLREMEDEKMDLFKKIVDLGFDPMVKIHDGEDFVEVTMSQAVLIRQDMKAGPKTKTDSNNHRTKHLKLVEDDSDDASPNTIH